MDVVGLGVDPVAWGMARVLLVMPQGPQRLGGPYLGQLFLAASLARAGEGERVPPATTGPLRSEDQLNPEPA